MFQNQFHVGPVHLQASCYCQVSKRQVHFCSCQLCWAFPVLYLLSRAVLAKPKQIIVPIRIITTILILILIWMITRFIIRRSKDAGRCEEGGNVVVKTIRLAASHIKRFIILSLQCSLAASHTAGLVPLSIPILTISFQILHNWKLLTFRLLRLSGTQLRIVHLIRWTNIYY